MELKSVLGKIVLCCTNVLQRYGECWMWRYVRNLTIKNTSSVISMVCFTVCLLILG